VQSIREKINAIADGKPGNTNTTAKILDKIIRDGRDVYGRPDMRFISVQPDVFLPRYILEHRGKYAHLLNPGNAINAEEFARLRRRFKRRKRICRILSNLAITKKRTRSFYEFLLEKLI